MEGGDCFLFGGLRHFGEDSAVIIFKKDKKNTCPKIRETINFTKRQLIDTIESVLLLRPSPEALRDQASQRRA